MTEPESDPLPPPEATPPNAFALPRTLYLWLGLVIAAYLIPVLVANVRRAAPSREEGLTVAQFQQYVSAESDTRTAFYLEATADGAAGGGLLLDPKTQRQKSLREAAQAYRQLAKSTNAPNMSRRALILDHALGKPLDKTLLEERLASDLHKSGASESEISAELNQWRTVYGGSHRGMGRADVPDSARRIQRMRLRFLEDQALRDLYESAGDKVRAAEFRERIHEQARRHSSRTLLTGVFALVGFLAGLIVLILFLRTAIDRYWPRVGRVATQEQRIGWGDLLDAFVFYLALSRGAGLAVGFVLIRLLAVAPTAHAQLAFQILLQFGTGLGALWYLHVAARRRGTTLADIGLTTRGALAANVGYGVAGYCAALPLIVLLGLLSQQIFRHTAPNTTPNPILPLMVGERDAAWRVVIFLLVAVGAPLFEELLFRGALFSGLRTRWNWVAAAAVSAMLFAIVHPPSDWLPIFGMGFVFATMREMRQSLVPGIVMHFLNNAYSFVALTSLFSTN